MLRAYANALDHLEVGPATPAQNRAADMPLPNFVRRINLRSHDAEVVATPGRDLLAGFEWSTLTGSLKIRHDLPAFSCWKLPLCYVMNQSRDAVVETSTTSFSHFSTKPAKT